MSLSGNLGFVPLDEVLRLLVRSEQNGCVDVRGTGMQGRVFIGGSGIDIATTYSDDELARHLMNSGYADQQLLHRVSSGETTLAAVADHSDGIVDLLREMSVESVYQMSVHGDEFYVHEDAATSYASPKSFDLEALLKDAEERSEDWDKVGKVVSDLTRPVVFRRDLGEREEITVRVDDWMVLSEVGSGSSVSEIAEALGTTDFWTARVTARLLDNDLVSLDGPVAGSELPEQDPVADRDDMDAFAPPETGTPIQVETPVEEVAPEVPAVEAPSDPDRSWWNEAVDEPVGEEDRAKPGYMAPESAGDLPDEDMPALDGGDDHSHVEEDTEVFLEKVFSELEAPEEDAEEGHGLLRRRRMGTLRDFSSDS